MNEDKSKETFVARWSRLKREAETAPPAERPGPAPEAAGEQPPELPPIEALTADSDFSVFFHPKVDEKLRRLALKKLFHDPRLNVVDVMEDDLFEMAEWTVPAEGWLSELKQFQHLLADNKEQEESQLDETKADALPDAQQVSEAASGAEAVEDRLTGSRGPDPIGTTIPDAEGLARGPAASRDRDVDSKG